MTEPGVQPFVAELVTVNSQTIAAADLKTAAAIAAAIAATCGAKVHAVYSKELYDAVLEERLKGKTLGKK